MPPGPLLKSIRRIDPKAKELVNADKCEWVRCSLAIVGRVRIPKMSRAMSPEMLSALVRETATAAYEALDDLPDEELSFEDLWNLVLFIEIPWTEQKSKENPELIRVLSDIANDLRGSRKIILWRGSTIERLLGSLAKGGKAWIPVSGDPLRGKVMEFARNGAERKVFEALFRRRIPEEDIDRLISVLGGNIKT
jgi:hypothetical protein